LPVKAAHQHIKGHSVPKMALNGLLCADVLLVKFSKIPKEHVMFDGASPQTLGQLFRCKSALGDCAALW